MSYDTRFVMAAQHLLCFADIRICIRTDIRSFLTILGITESDVVLSVVNTQNDLLLIALLRSNYLVLSRDFISCRTVQNKQDMMDRLW